MNRLFFTGLLFLGFPCIANAQDTLAIDSSYANGHYLQRLDFFKKMPNQKPLKIFLLCGINDMKRGTPNEVILANYLRMIKQIKAESPATQIYFQSVLPVNIAMLPKSYDNLSYENISALNEGLYSLCKAYGLHYVNLHAVFADGNGELKKELSIDGLHLKSAAYIIWAAHLKKEHLL